MMRQQYENSDQSRLKEAHLRGIKTTAEVNDWHHSWLESTSHPTPVITVMKAIAYIIPTFAFLTFATASPVAEAAQLGAPVPREPFIFDKRSIHVSVPFKREPSRFDQGSIHVTVPQD